MEKYKFKRGELRINNIAKYKGIPYRIALIGFDEVVLLDENKKPFDVKISKLEPVNLTDEWFLDFGFKYNGFSINMKPCFMKTNIYFQKNEKDSFDFETLDTTTKVKYVHKLQNLYFDITDGIELELNN